MTSDRRSLVRLIGPHERAGAVRLILLMVGAALTEGLGVMLLVPLLAALDPGNTSQLATLFSRLHLERSLGTALLLFVILIVLRGILALTRGMATLRFELGVVDRLRRQVWRALLGADWRMLASLRRSDSTSVLVTGIDRVGYAMNQAVHGLAALLTLFGLGLAGLVVAPLITLGGMLGGLLVLLAYGRLRRRAAHLGDRLGAAYGAMQGSLADSLGAIRVVKSLGSEARAEQAAFTDFAQLSGSRLAYQRDMGLGQIMLQIGGAMVLAVLVWTAAVRWHLSAAQILPVVALFARSLPLLGSVQECWQNFAHARPAINAAFALIDQAEAAQEGEAPSTFVHVPALGSEIRLERVRVHFDGSPFDALADIDLLIPARSIVALTGASGSGKSTLADLLGGLISPDGGKLSVDGVTIDAANRRAWRTRVAYVHQDAVLIAATLRENLAWGRPFDDDALTRALRAAAADFALDLPQGLDTVLGDGGRVLSGGERQRIALARALLREPALLILDEATSALDPASEAQVGAAVSQLAQRMTVLVIGHRSGLLAQADQAVRLDRGRIVPHDYRTGKL